MNYKQLFNRLLKLILFPSKAWREIKGEGRGDVLSGFVYPMIGLCGLVSFVAGILEHYSDKPYEVFRYAMTDCCIMCVALFGSFFLSSYIVNNVERKMFGIEEDINNTYTLVGYSMSVVFVTYALFPLFTDSRILLYFLQLYTVFVVWEAAALMTKLDDNRRAAYTMSVAGSIVILTGTIYALFNILM